MVAYTFKGRFVAPIAAGLGIEIPRKHGFKIAAGVEIRPKIHTFRGYGKRRHARPGETLQLYYAMRSPNCFLIGEAVCIEVLPAIVWPGFGSMMIDGKVQSARQIVRFARNDGFASVVEMQSFFDSAHKGADKVEGVVIKWRTVDAPA